MKKPSSFKKRIKYKRYKNSIEKFLSSDKGQRFFNFAYSIGAAIVIWGALFKILHLPEAVSCFLSVWEQKCSCSSIRLRHSPENISLGRSFSRTKCKNPEDRARIFRREREPSLSVETAKAEVVTEETIPISPRPMPKELWEYPKASI